MFHYKSTLRVKWAHCYEYLINGFLDTGPSAEDVVGRFGLTEWANFIIMDKKSRRVECSELVYVMASLSIKYGQKDLVAFLMDPSVHEDLLSLYQRFHLVRHGLLNALHYYRPDIAKLLISMNKDVSLYQKPISNELIQLMDQPEYEGVEAFSELLINDHIKNSESNQSEGSWLWLQFAATENCYSALRDLLEWGVPPEVPRSSFGVHLCDYYHIELDYLRQIQEEKSMMTLLIHGGATRTQHRKIFSKRLLRGNGPNFDLILKKALHNGHVEVARLARQQGGEVRPNLHDAIAICNLASAAMVWPGH